MESSTKPAEYARSDGGTPSSQLFGHPRGLAVLSGTELWERFSYYGMMGLLTLYKTKQLLLPGHVERVWGFPAFRGCSAPC